MGRVIREGFGYGFTKNEAMRNFTDSLNMEYGNGSYEGGGNDIVAWISAECTEKPVPAIKATKMTTKGERKRPGKLINGYSITNATAKNFHLRNNSNFERKTAYAANLKDAKTVAGKLVTAHNVEFEILPIRLFQEAKTGTLYPPSAVLTMIPVGGKPAEEGTWYFKVECRC